MFLCNVNLSIIDYNAVIFKLRMKYGDLWGILLHRWSWLPTAQYELSYWKYSDSRERNAIAIDYYPLGIEQDLKEKGHAETKIS